jgi:hypothetical protein
VQLINTPSDVHHLPLVKEPDCVPTLSTPSAKPAGALETISDHVTPSLTFAGTVGSVSEVMPPGAAVVQLILEPSDVHHWPDVSVPILAPAIGSVSEVIPDDGQFVPSARQTDCPEDTIEPVTFKLPTVRPPDFVWLVELVFNGGGVLLPGGGPDGAAFILPKTRNPKKANTKSANIISIFFIKLFKFNIPKLYHKNKNSSKMEPFLFVDNLFYRSAH